jgi:hypothetical protein
MSPFFLLAILSAINYCKMADGYRKHLEEQEKKSESS